MTPTRTLTQSPVYFGTEERDGRPCLGPARAGRGYELAGTAVLARLGDATLVHGSIRRPGSKEETSSYEHAWVVLADGKVWEPAEARLWDPGLFWCVMQPVVTASYTHAELASAITRTGHWGPWR